jgi:hypothetical protein
MPRAHPHRRRHPYRGLLHKIYNRLLVPLTAADQPQAPPALRAALATISRNVDAYTAQARLIPNPRT